MYMRKLHFAVCLLLVAVFLTQPAIAASPASLSAGGSTLSERLKTSDNAVASVMKVRPDITEEQAAERLYYLGLLSGVGTISGKTHFALSRALTKLEAIIMVIRLMGIETEVLESSCLHPFTDVPDWGSAYVGYFWENGLLLGETTTLFSPDTAVPSAVFMKYMLNALGYVSDGSNYSLADAALIGQRIGICTESIPAITRGQAVMMMYRTLDTTTAGSNHTLSFDLVEAGILDYQDVQFLLWNENNEEVQTYIEAEGYSLVKSMPEGKYAITLADTDRCLNVRVDGAGEDYEGVGVTVWNQTSHISQKFRLEQMENGNYRLYSCLSGGGYKRALGFGRNNTAGLYSTHSQYVGEFILQYADVGDGSWHLLSAADPLKAVSTKNERNDAVISLQPLGAEGYAQRWTFSFDGVVNEEGYEFALFPADILCITQGYYDTYSHQKQNALDFTSASQSAFAPFTGKIARIDRGYYRYNTVWLQSCDKVVYADGTVDYMTVVFMHDNNVSDLSVGQIVAQGEHFYQAGVAGGATGSHIHIACIRGEYKSSMVLTGSGDVYPEDALFIRADTAVQSTYGLDWVYLD